MRKSRGEITKLNTLFEKYKKILKAPQGTVVDAFCGLVLELMSIEIQKTLVTYNVHTRVLHLKVSGPLKSEIKLRKSELLAHLKGRLGEQNAPKEIL